MPHDPSAATVRIMPTYAPLIKRPAVERPLKANRAGWRSGTPAGTRSDNARPHSPDGAGARGERHANVMLSGVRLHETARDESAAERRGKAFEGALAESDDEALLRDLDALLEIQRAATPLSPSLRSKLAVAMDGPVPPAVVHTDSLAHEASHAMRAKGFTLGNHIYVGKHGADDNIRTFGHELHHVITNERDRSSGLSLQRRVIVAGKPLEPGTWEWDLVQKAVRYQNIHGIFDQMHNSPGEIEYQDIFDMSLDMKRRQSAMRSVSEKAATNAEYHGIDANDPDPAKQRAKQQAKEQMCCDYGSRFRLDPQFWSPKTPIRRNLLAKDETGESGDAIFHMKPGQRPSEAIGAVFSPGWYGDEPKTLLECNSMMVAEQHRALLEVLGADAFDKLIKQEGGVIAPMVEGSTGQSPLMRFFKQMEVAAPKDDPMRNLLPGDWVYLANLAEYSTCEKVVYEWSLKKKLKDPRGAWSGEHALYLGNGKFAGFGVADADYDLIREHFATARNNICDSALELCEQSPRLAGCRALTPEMSDVATAKDIPGLDKGKGTVRVWRLDADALRRAVAAACEAKESQ